MELTQQIGTLQDDVKLLKGEIKSILKEVRAALLNRDNPFTADAPPVFRAVARTEADEPAADGLTAMREELEPPRDLPQQPPAPAPVPSPQSPSAPAVEYAPAPAQLRPAQEAVEPPPAPQWSMLTVASLTAWAEDALAELGPKRFQIVLDLACFAELLSPSVRDVLGKLADLVPPREGEERPLHVNECLVVLRQLEAILQGEKITKLPRRRGQRHGRVR